MMMAGDKSVLYPIESYYLTLDNFVQSSLFWILVARTSSWIV